MIRVRPIERGDRPWVVRRLEDAFGDAHELEFEMRLGITVRSAASRGLVHGAPSGLLVEAARIAGG